MTWMPISFAKPPQNHWVRIKQKKESIKGLGLNFEDVWIFRHYDSWSVPTHWQFIQKSEPKNTNKM